MVFRFIVWDDLQSKDELNTISVADIEWNPVDLPSSSESDVSMGFESSSGSTTTSSTFFGGGFGRAFLFRLKASVIVILYTTLISLPVCLKVKNTLTLNDYFKKLTFYIKWSKCRVSAQRITQHFSSWIFNVVVCCFDVKIVMFLNAKVVWIFCTNPRDRAQSAYCLLWVLPLTILLQCP